MKLNKYFTTFESIDFDKVLAKFKSQFSQEDLEKEHMEIQAKLDSANSSEKPQVKINVVINNIIKENVRHFKEFLSSDNCLKQYSNCRALKQLEDPQKLIKKTYTEEQQSHASNNIKSINAHVDDNWNVYYAICKNFTGSDMENFDPQIIGKIGSFVDGSISI